jgi:hypothetical protein
VKNNLTRLKIGFIIPLAMLLAFFILMQVKWDIHNVSSVSTDSGIGVYWDKYCITAVKEINWGTLYLGSKKSMTVFIRNQLQEVIYLKLNTTNWNPKNAYSFLVLSWDYEGNALNSGEVLKVNFLLSVSPLTSGITNFSFDIIISETLPKSPDVNHDGKVDMRDVSLVAASFGVRLGQPKYDSALDINNDGTIDMIDISITAKSFGMLI